MDTRIPAHALVRSTALGLAVLTGGAIAQARPRPLPASVIELQKATESWRRLEKDVHQRRRRTAWLHVVTQLERVGHGAKGPTAALALLRAGHAMEELSHWSGATADLRRAAALDHEAATADARGSLADDALLDAAHLEREGLHESSVARRTLERAAALHGDRHHDAVRLLAELGPEPVKEKPKARASKVAKAERAHESREVAPARAPAKEPAREAKADLPPPPLPPVLPEDRSAPAPRKVANLAANVRALKAKVLADTTWSLSEQVGLKVRRIVVDAGHGGHDTGAIGPTGVYEKTVTLAVAKALAKDLEARGYEVVMTRDSDEFVSLEERTRIANRAKGDLFVSVHANATRSHREHGVETYSLNVTSNRFAIRLAARENASGERPQSDLPFLLADLATRADTVDSDRLARDVQDSIVHRTTRFGRAKDLGVKHALFYVLLGAKMPAVLVEPAFVSNRAEEKKLASPRYQTALAQSIADGVNRFVARRAQLASSQ